jgi:hypothetical protein
MKLRLPVGLLLVVLVRVADADDWPGPVEIQVFSPSLHYKVRVLPGKSVGDTFGFSGSPKGPYATAELSARSGSDDYKPVSTFTLLNPVAPIDVFLSDSGHVITFDNWHNMGYGKVVVLYGSNGAVLRAYALQDLFPATDIALFVPSTSSIWWRKSGDPPKLAKGQRNICVGVQIKGRNLEFNLETGEFAFRAEGQCKPLL